jgi:aminoglycoside phosphotransferase family enzyme
VLAIERRFERNLHELLASVEQRAEIGHVQALERFAHAFIAGHARTFQMRADGGCVREGHGDLRAEHVLVDTDVEIVDGVEFDAAMREIDVADDLAFLVSIWRRAVASLRQDARGRVPRGGGRSGR